MTRESGSTDEIQAVWSAFGKGCWRVLRHPEASWFSSSSPLTFGGTANKFRQAGWEKIWTHAQPFATTIAVTAFCFTTFRITGSKWWTKARDILSQSTSLSATSTNTVRTPLGHLSRQSGARQEKMGEMMQVPFDFMLSCLLGSSVFLVQFDAEQMQDDFLQMPLLPGKSLVHECVCPDVVQAVAQLYRSHHYNYDDETHRFFAHFAENCQARSRFVDRRRQVGMPQPDVVPYPGLQGRITRQS